jgi:transcriptional regulator with XRE-family HTH domain
MERDALVQLVAQNIETIMARKGTNSNAVAKRLGTNPTLLYDILSGKSKSPRLDTLHKIAVIGLGVPVSALLMEPGEDDLDQEIVQTFGLMPPDVRRRMLQMAQAWLAQPASA